MKPTLRNALLFFAATLAPALAQNPAATPAEQLPPPELKKLIPQVELKDGDTFVFLGDSITHQCLYTQYVEDYFYTRYPKTHLHFHNAGVGGDRAQDALDRFDEDVAAYKPKYVSILLGMNDGTYTNYQQPIFETYQHGMSLILDKIGALNATPIPMTPTMFDSVASKKLRHPEQETKQMYYNGVLSLYGSWLREQALNRGLGFVDMWGPLNNISFTQRKKDAAWSMIPDGVHPAETGQVIMAVAILNDVVGKSSVSQIVIGITGGKAASHVTNGTLGNLAFQPTSASFDFAAEALPWVLPPEAADGYQLSMAGHHFSNERIRVSDLAPGRYDLKIDGQLVGTYPSAALADGVELEKNEKTPQYQQGLKVALLNKQKTTEATHPLRDQWRDLKMKRKIIARLEETNAPGLEKAKADLETWRPGFMARVKELDAKVLDFETQIYQLNQPAPHHYELSLAAAPARKKPAEAPVP